jgi:hypothetical protein
MEWSITILYKDDLTYTQSRGEGTGIHVFLLNINLVDERLDGTPVMPLGRLERIVRRLAFKKCLSFCLSVCGSICLYVCMCVCVCVCA